MSSTLREQLLKAGLVTEADVRRANQPPPRTSKRKPPPTPEPTRAARAAQAAKAAQDQELNRRQREKAERRARHAEIDQWIEQGRLAPAEGDDYYSFVDERRIGRLAVNPATRAGLVRGELAIVRLQRRYAIVPAAIAARVRERDPSRIVTQQAADVRPAAADAGADPYAAYPVPDDLLW